MPSEPIDVDAGSAAPAECSRHLHKFLPGTTRLRGPQHAHPRGNRASVAALAVAAVLGACAAPDSRTRERFAAWREQDGGQVAALEAHLQAAGVRHMPPLHQMLRSAASWRDCGAEPFAVPPQPQWPAVVSVLRLLQRLHERGVLTAYEVHSGYRDPALNDCAGGAPRSAHLRAFAIDLTPTAPPQALDALCAFWREHGAAWNMGLGRYPSGRIHIDTLGYRSWGGDGTARTALCGPARLGPE